MRGSVLTLLIFGITGLIGSSNGFKCYQCNNAPGIAKEADSCKDAETEPDKKTLQECKGEMSSAVALALAAAKSIAPDIAELYTNLTQGGDKPACILITGKYNDIQGVIRECATVNDQILKTKCIKLEASGASGEACACASEGCNGKKTSMEKGIAGSINPTCKSKIYGIIFAILFINYR